jgi:hypothetical protein
MELKIPSRLAAICRKTPERAAWLDHLPDVLRRLEDLWALTPDAPLDGEKPSCSYVAAVRSADGTPTVLKIAIPHMEESTKFTVCASGAGTRLCDYLEPMMIAVPCSWSVVSQGQPYGFWQNTIRTW